MTASSSVSAPQSLRAFLSRDWAVERSYRLPFVMNLVGSLFTLVIIYQAAKLIRPTAGGSGSQLGHGYFSFAVIGTVVIQVVHTATQSFASKLREEQTTGTLEALLACPTSPSLLVVGTGLYNVVRAIIQAVVVLATASLFGLHLQDSPRWLALAAVLLIGLFALAAEVGLLVAAFTVVFKRGTSLSDLINAGLVLLAGIWYPVSSLPTAARALAECIPFTWGLTALRDALLFGHLDPFRVVGVLVAAAAGLPLALWCFRLGVDRARMKGSLGQY